MKRCREEYEDEVITIPQNVKKAKRVKKDKKKKKERERKYLTEYLPDDGAFGAILIGATGQGKTHMLKKLLDDPQFYGPAPNKDKSGQFFDVLIIFSDSLEIEDEYDQFEEGIRVHKKSPDDFVEVMSSIREQQVDFFKDEEERPYMPRICVVIDDCVHKKIFQYYAELCEWLYTNGRHYHICPIITTQYFKSISPRIRTNAKIVFLFKTFDIGEIEKFIESFVLKDDRGFIRSCLKDIFNEPYSFLAYLPCQIYNQRVFKNLQELLVADDVESTKRDRDSDDHDEAPKKKRRKFH